METDHIDSDKPLVVIVGQTASGKTDLAIKIAKKYGGEIICADSRTIYKGMDIGTAKPGKAEREAATHYLLDIIAPDQTYSASDFKKDSTGALRRIYKRGKVPILTGGTGLYINSLIYDFEFGRPPDPHERQKLQRLDIESLQKSVKDLGLTSDQINLKNKRHLIRAIENKGLVRSKKSLRKNTLLLGIREEEDNLKQRIEARNETMIRQGLETEVKKIVEKYGWDAPGLQTIAYKEWRPYFRGEQDIHEVKENMFRDNWQYARRQKTWFSRNKFIHWFENGGSFEHVKGVLNK